MATVMTQAMPEAGARVAHNPADAATESSSFDSQRANIMEKNIPQPAMPLFVMRDWRAWDRVKLGTTQQASAHAIPVLPRRVFGTAREESAIP